MPWTSASTHATCIAEGTGQGFLSQQPYVMKSQHSFGSVAVALADELADALVASASSHATAGDDSIETAKALVSFASQAVHS